MSFLARGSNTFNSTISLVNCNVFGEYLVLLNRGIFQLNCSYQIHIFIITDFLLLSNSSVTFVAQEMASLSLNNVSWTTRVPETRVPLCSHVSTVVPSTRKSCSYGSNVYLTKILMIILLQETDLGLFRSDYFFCCANACIKQVEFNTIASSFGCTTSQLVRAHKYNTNTVT